MLARRIAPFVALAVVVALVAILVWRDDEAIVLHSDPSVPVALDGTRTSTGLQSTPAEEPASAHADRRSVELAFGDVLRPVDGASGAPGRALEVLCFTASGEMRRATLDDVVRDEDLEPGGLWIVCAKARCPVVVASELPAARVASGTSDPLEIGLVACGTLEVVVEAPPPGCEPIEAVVLTSDTARAAVRRWIAAPSVVVDEISASALQALGDASPASAAAAEHVVQLTRGGSGAVAAARLVAAVRSSAFVLDRTNANTERVQRDRQVSRMWRSRLAHAGGSSGETLEFACVPSEVDLTLVVSARGQVEYAPQGSAPHKLNPRDGVAQTTEPIRLHVGERTSGSLRVLPTCFVRGRLPANVLPNPQLALSVALEKTPEEIESGSGRTSHFLAPTLHVDGSFEWQSSIGGSFKFRAEWREVGNVIAWTASTFELALGGVHDLGLLEPTGSGRLSIHPRTNALPTAIAAFDPAAVVVRASLIGPIDTTTQDPEAERVGAPRRSLALSLTEPLVVAGIEPGLYRVVTHGLGARGAGTAEWEIPNEQLVEALAKREDHRLLVLVDPHRSSNVLVDSDAHVDVDIDVRLAGALEVEFTLPSESNGVVTAVRAIAANSDRRTSQPVAATTSGTAAGRPALIAPGEWSVFVVIEGRTLDPIGLFTHVGRADVVVVEGQVARVTVSLEEGTSIRYDAGDAELPLQLDEMPWLDLTSIGMRWSMRGWESSAVLPRTRFRIGERVVETGAPGSEVVLE